MVLRETLYRTTEACNLVTAGIRKTKHGSKAGYFMSDIKLFQFSADDAHPQPSHTAPLERELHNLMQKHMECFLGIRFVASEYGTGKFMAAA